MKIHLCIGKGFHSQAVCGTSKHFLPNLGVHVRATDKYDLVDCQKCLKKADSWKARVERDQLQGKSLTY